MLWTHAAFLALFVGTTAVLSVLSMLNVRHGEREVTAEADWFEEVVPDLDTDRMLRYNRARTGTGLLQSWVTTLVVLLLLYAGVAADAVRFVEGLSLPPVAAGVLFFAAVTVTFRLVALPFDAYDTFVVEEVFDFNRQTPALWARDALLGLGMGLVFVSLVGGGLLAFVEWFGAQWWLAGVGLLAAFLLVLQVVYPRVILPLYYDFEPVEGGELREAVDRVFDRAGFSCEEIYVMDGSSRSSHSNALFTGFGPAKRVVLYDTLVDQMSLTEIQAVLAHELAHYQRRHLWKNFLAGVLLYGVLLYLLASLMAQPWLYGMFGVPEGVSYAGLLLAGLWVLRLQQLLAPLTNRLSLRFEREADRFAADTVDGEAMVDALRTLAEENLSNPFPHPLYEAFHYDHPPVSERIRRIRERTGPG